MSLIKIEKIGGFAGFGGVNSHLKSIGEIAIDKLSEQDKKAIDDLFNSENLSGDSFANDSFRYKISKTTTDGTKSIEAFEAQVPAALKQVLKDQII